MMLGRGRGLLCHHIPCNFTPERRFQQNAKNVASTLCAILNIVDMVLVWFSTWSWNFSLQLPLKRSRVGIRYFYFKGQFYNIFWKMDLHVSVVSFMQLWCWTTRIIYCSAWTNCSMNVQAEGCTLHDLYTQVVQYNSWSQFNTRDANQQRYHEAVDSLQNLCNNIEPGQALCSCNTPFTTLLFDSRLINVLFAAGSRAKYCNQHVCLFVCLSYLKNYKSTFTTFSVHLSCGCGSFILWRQYDTICTSGFAIASHLHTRADSVSETRRMFRRVRHWRHWGSLPSLTAFCL